MIACLQPNNKRDKGMVAPLVVFSFLCLAIHQQQRGVLGVSIRPPSNGDLTLNGTTLTFHGILRIYYNGEFRSVCWSQGFTQSAANTACTQLGYGRAIRYSAVNHSATNEGSGAGGATDLLTPLPLVFTVNSCATQQSHILRCNYTVEAALCDSVSLECDKAPPEPYLGEVRLTNRMYKSRGLLEVYLNDDWGTVCIQEFNIGIGNVICRQLGYTNAVRYNRFKPVDNERIVWLREFKQCNGTHQSCFKFCYETPTIRNIYCGNVDDVELECTFNTSLANINSGTPSTCHIVIRKVHISVIVILIVVFCGIFLLYAVLFIGRFITAAWHKSERYKVHEPERRFQFPDYHEKLKKNSVQLSESLNPASLGLPPTIIENQGAKEDNLSD